MRTRWFRYSIAGVPAVLLLAATGCGEEAAAIRVGDSYVSQSDFMDEVGEAQEWQEEAAAEQAAEAGMEPEDDDPEDLDEGSYPQEFVGQLATDRVLHMLTVELFESQGLETTVEDEAQGCAASVEQQTGAPLTGQEGPPCDLYLESLNYSDAPPWMQERIVAGAAMGYVLQRDVAPEELEAASQDVIENTEITINSKYGTWDDSLFEQYLASQSGEAASPIVQPEGPFVQGDGADGTATEGPGDGSAAPPPAGGDPGAAPDAGAPPDAGAAPDAGAEPPPPVDPSDVDPDLLALLEDYGVDPGMLTEADLAAIEQMGMDPADLSDEELAELESQLQMSMGGGQPGGAPAP